MQVYILKILQYIASYEYLKRGHDLRAGWSVVMGVLGVLGPYCAGI